MAADEHDLKTWWWWWWWTKQAHQPPMQDRRKITKTGLKVKVLLFHVRFCSVRSQWYDADKMDARCVDNFLLWGKLQKKDQLLQSQHSQPLVSFRMKYPAKILKNPEVLMLQYQERFDQRKDGIPQNGEKRVRTERMDEKNWVAVTAFSEFSWRLIVTNRSSWAFLSLMAQLNHASFATAYANQWKTQLDGK